MSPAVSCQNFAWHQTLIEYLPLIRSTAARAYRHLHGSARDDAIADVLADCAASFARLAQQGRAHFWLIPALATFAVRKRNTGRVFGSSESKNDVLSPIPRGEAQVYSLDALEASNPTTWRIAIAETHRMTPADAACFRIDFERWLSELPDRHRTLALALAEGERPGDLAKRLCISPGRISQLRRELREAWQIFQGELEGSAALATA